MVIDIHKGIQVYVSNFYPLIQINITQNELYVDQGIHCISIPFMNTSLKFEPG